MKALGFMNSLFDYHLIIPYGIPPSLTVILCVFIASLTIKLGHRVREYQLFTLICIWQIVYNVDLVLRTIVVSEDVMMQIASLDHLFYIFSLPICIHFIHESLNVKQRRWLIMVLYGQAFVLLPFTQTEWYLEGLSRYYYGWFINSGILLKLYAVEALLGLMYCLSLILKSLRDSKEDKQRTKTTYILVGFFTLFALNILNIVPTLGISFYPPSNFGFIPMLFIAYGLLRHHLVGAEAFQVDQKKLTPWLLLITWTPLVSSIFFWHFNRDLFLLNPVSYLPTLAAPLLVVLVCFSLTSTVFFLSGLHINRYLFALVCFLWGIHGMDEIITFLSREEITVLRLKQNDMIFLLFLITLFPQLIHRVVRQSTPRMMFVFYVLSGMMLLVSQTEWMFDGFHINSTYGFLPEMTLGLGMYYAAGMLGALWSLWLVVQARQNSQEKRLRRMYEWLMVTCVLYALVWLLNIPLIAEQMPYQLDNLIVIPLLILGITLFGRDLTHSNKYIRAKTYRDLSTSFLTIVYTLLILSTLWVLQRNSLDDIYYGVYPYGLPPLISYLICMFFALVAIRVGRLNTETLLFSLICMVISFLNMDLLLNSILIDAKVAISISRLDHLAVVFLPALLLHLSWTITQGRGSFKLVQLFYLLSFLYMPFTQSEHYLREMYTYYWGFHAGGGWLLLGVFILGFAAMVISVIWLWEHMSTVKDAVEKEKTLFILMGMLSTGLLNLANLPANIGIEFYPLGNFTFVPICLFAYGFFKRNVSELMHFVRLILFHALFIAVLLWVTWLLYQILPRDHFWLNLAMITIVLRMGFNPLRSMLKNLLDLLFASSRFDLEREYNELTTSLTLHLDSDVLRQQVIPRMLRVLGGRFFLIAFADKAGLNYTGELVLNKTRKQRAHADAMHIASESVSINGDHPILMLLYNKQGTINQEQMENWMQSQGLELLKTDPFANCIEVYPIFFQAMLTGFIGVGEKLNGELYSRAESAFIRSLSQQLGSHTENRKLVEDLKKQIQIQIAEKERISALSKAFRLFVPEQFLSYIAKEGLEKIKVGNADNSFITILFADIRSFTRLAESLTPEEVFTFLNDYFRRMHHEIKRFDGFIDKFVGDAIMALFDQREATDSEEATCAVDCAVNMQISLQEFNMERRMEGLFPIAAGIGVHSGPVFIGTVGSETRMESTVIGDAVNLSARLESMTKYYGCKILVSETTMNLVDKSRYCYRELDWIKVKGKSKPVTIYEVFDADPPHLREQKTGSVRYLKEGMECRKRKDWKGAMQAFRESLKLNPQDLAVQVHLDQIRSLMISPPDEDWDGAVEFKS